MAVCKHCGAEINDDLQYCPNCGQSNMEEKKNNFFGLDEEIGNDYDIFDSSDDFDALLSRELSQNKDVVKTEEIPMIDIADILDGDNLIPPAIQEDGIDDLSQISESLDLENMDFVLPDGTSASGMDFKLSEIDDLSAGEMPMEELGAGAESNINMADAIDADLVDELNFVELDGLLQDLEEEEKKSNAKCIVDANLGAMFAGGVEEDKEDKKKKQKAPLLKRVFDNVPVDPSKIKPEPTKEEIAEAKQKKAETKKQAAEAKKVEKQQKKELAKQAKEQKAQEKALAKEAKKAKKLEEAKQILEEVQVTRINRVGATIVFGLFAICAVALIIGSDLFGYSVSVNNAEKSFNLALGNDVSHYNDAYEQIYGLEVKPEDQELNDKIMTVMFVNKELNSYNNYMVMENYEEALHSLLKGIYRYGKYYESAIPLGIDRDLDFVRTQILQELEATFQISEDEAEVLRSQLEQAMTSENASEEYSLAIYEIVRECKLTKE